MSTQINYNLLSHERTNEMQVAFQEKLRRRNLEGASASFRNNVLTSVIYGNYEAATQQIQTYSDDKVDYPTFESRTSRYVSHCLDLVAAIDSKRNFPGLSSLPPAKQQELLEKVVDHFDELKVALKRIEAIYAEMQLNDFRSTVYVVKTASVCVGVIFVVGLILEIVRHVYGSAEPLLMDVIKDFARWLFSLEF